MTSNPTPLRELIERVEADMPVISLWQPFASLIFEWDGHRGDFVKSHETRGFKLPDRLIGENIAIHATAKFPSRRFISSALNDLCYDRFGCAYDISLPFGQIIGIVRFGEPKPTEELARDQPADEIAAGDWSTGRWAWPIMSAIRLAEPIVAKGKQGWWKHPIPLRDPQQRITKMPAASLKSRSISIEGE